MRFGRSVRKAAKRTAAGRMSRFAKKTGAGRIAKKLTRSKKGRGFAGASTGLGGGRMSRSRYGK